MGREMRRTEELTGEAMIDAAVGGVETGGLERDRGGIDRSQELQGQSKFNGKHRWGFESSGGLVLKDRQCGRLHRGIETQTRTRSLFFKCGALSSQRHSCHLLARDAEDGRDIPDTV